MDESLAELLLAEEDQELADLMLEHLSSFR